jgi:hypothetical protein
VVDAHLASCAECRRELEQLRATVALLDRLPPARAPAGFVDRVMAEAYRPSWPRRVLDALFVPLRVKLPLEAVALVLVSVSALYVYQWTPEVRELELEHRQAREAPAPTPAESPAPAPPAASSSTRPEIVPPPPASKDRAAEAKRAPARPDAAREEPRPVPPAVAAPPPAGTASDLRDAQVATSEPKTSAKEEAPARSRADAAPGAAPPSAAPDQIAKSVEPPASPEAAGRRPSVAQSKPGSPPEPFAARSGSAGGVALGAPPAPSVERAPGEALGAAKARTAARLTRSVDASGRLTVPARAPAERALDSLLGRLGGARVGSLLEGDRGLIVIDVVVPAVRYREFVEGLGRIGPWVTEYESGTLPDPVHVEVALTVEP